MKTIAIIIPARYGSTRFPGKPLAMIAGQTMLGRVVDLARGVADVYVDDARCAVSVCVATDDTRIADHAAEVGVACVMTGVCATGSDRVLQAVAAMDVMDTPDFVLNLQGDAPLIPPFALHALIDSYLHDPDRAVVTPVYQLSWDALDMLRVNKQVTPFSGTTVVRADDGRAVWFSKHILPAIRKEDRSQPLSPVFQHLGVYGYRLDALEAFCALEEGIYERLEGLEQLRFLENGICVHTAEIPLEHSITGIDAPEDVVRAEAVLAAREKG